MAKYQPSHQKFLTTMSLHDKWSFFIKISEKGGNIGGKNNYLWARSGSIFERADPGSGWNETYPKQ